MFRLITGIACLLQFAAAVQASELPHTSVAVVPYWQPTSLAQADDAYRDSVQNNRALLRKSLRNYTDRLVSDAVSYGPAAVVLGAAIAGAVSDTHLRVGGSPYLNLELRDAVHGDRSLRLVFSRAW